MAKNKTTSAQGKKSSGSAKRQKPPMRRRSLQEGPVTLEDARALVSPPRARRSLRLSATKGGTDKETLANLANKRQAVRTARQSERDQRVRDYKAVMALMKRRGVKRVATAAAGGRRRAPAAAAPLSFSPLQIFAEGDSWFDYPVPFFGGSIVPRLESLLGVPILNLADAGDEVRFMLGVKQKKRLIDTLTQGCPAGGPWDALLFSGGGNDIVDNPLVLWLRDFKAGVTANNLINQARFDAALALVRGGYEDLIAMRDKLSPNTHILFHSYDFAIPDGRGVCGYGPWLKPAFDMRGFPSREAFDTVKAMLSQFAGMLATLAGPKVAFVNTQGTLPPTPASWHNELHPQRKGFDAIAARFRQEIKTLFPGRVL